jgi:putative heme iron utilization protein
MSEVITPAISDRICKHMNEDHGSAIALYAQVYGNAPQTETAIMESIDSQGMNLLAEIPGATVPVRIEFDHPLKDAEDAHHTLVAMIKQARTLS